ncbi:hypothetical protein CVT91_08505 [Candidatus Atribacteria bacterium HGW-Atribacteria-1]|nr:MAG: hypothetical protein CVT91_08505 [Candidatus Atribacteria bacterium HGW-Atribacteria-1]
MSDERFEKMKKLIEEGESFNYSNFSLKGEHGYPSSLKVEYIAWKIKVENLLLSLFGKASPLFETYKKGDSLRLIGNGPDNFESAQSLILGSLIASIDTLEFEPKARENKRKTFEKSNKVFIVHGNDEKLKNTLEIFLNEIGMETIVLHRKPDEGMTIIEKFEKHSKDASYAFILLTPDDVSCSALKTNMANSDIGKEMRARQNVIFEFGYFVGKLGRKRVCCLYKKGVSLPTDISGMVYKEIVDNVEEVAFAILKDLKAAGYQVIK